MKSETHKLYTPAKDCSFLIFILGQVCALEDLERVYDGNTSVELSAWYVVVEILREMSTRQDAARWWRHLRWYTTGWPPWACLGQ